MTVKVAIKAEDGYHNRFYFIYEDGDWRAIDTRCVQHSLSNFSSNSAEFYIALSRLGEYSTIQDAIDIIRKYADYLVKDSVKLLNPD